MLSVGKQLAGLPVDHPGRGIDVPSVVGLPFWIVGSNRENLDGFVGKTDVDTVAVELDFVDPAGFALGADGLHLFMLKDLDELHATWRFKLAQTHWFWNL